MTNLPKGLRVTLKNMFHFGLPEVRETRTSEDGSIKFMFATSDNRLIESVFMPEDDRSTLCVSTQIGCKMSCAFCVTSKIGFVRDLTAGGDRRPGDGSEESYGPEPDHQYRPHGHGRAP